MFFRNPNCTDSLCDKYIFCEKCPADDGLHFIYGSLNALIIILTGAGLVLVVASWF